MVLFAAILLVNTLGCWNRGILEYWVLKAEKGLFHYSNCERSELTRSEIIQRTAPNKHFTKTSGFQFLLQFI